MSADKADAPEAPAVEPATTDSTRRGRYIPYSGGSAGWFENSGVLKSERANNYGYAEEMDFPEVRGKQFLRWGMGDDRRSSARRQRKLPVNVVLGERTLAMTTWDINERGVRLQFTEDLGLEVGRDLTIELLEEAGGAPRQTLDGQVIWLEQGGSTRAVWNVGVFFPYVSAEDAATLRTLLG